MAWNVHRCKTTLSFGESFVICFDKNLNGLVTRMNFYSNRRVFEIDFVPSTILSSDNDV